MAERLTVLTPWFPGPVRPFMGSFVEATVRAALPLFPRVDVVHLEDWPAPRGPLVTPVVQRVLHRMLDDLLAQESTRATLRPTPAPGGWGLAVVPVPVVPRRPWHAYALSHDRVLRAALGGDRLAGDVVHAHVGLPGGLLAVRHARPGARVVVTEHASFLGRVLDRPQARRLYEEVLDRCDGFLCVSEVLRQQLVEVFPQHAATIRVLPNPVDFRALTPSAARGGDLRRWLFIGSLSERKRPLELLEAFAAARREVRPDLTLTYVGGGALEGAVRERVAGLRLGGCVSLLGAVPPSAVPTLLAQHDLLVHPATYETFGMTPVEAVAAGLPVLVADYAAARETLEPVLATGAQLFPVGAGSGGILDGYRALLARAPDLDPLAARAALEARFGYDAVARRLAEAYGTTVPTPEER